MSPRAAWRLESLGLPLVYDYVAGKADWGAAGLPLQGARGRGRAGEVVRRDVPTCRLDDRLEDVRARVKASGWDRAVVLNDERVVLGLVRPRALEEAPDDATAEEAMSPGPGTVRPSLPVEELEKRLQKPNVKAVLVTTADGRLVGAVRLRDLGQ